MKVGIEPAPIISPMTASHRDGSCQHLPRNRHKIVLDTIHDRCYPKMTQEGIAYHLGGIGAAAVSGTGRIATAPMSMGNIRKRKKK